MSYSLKQGNLFGRIGSGIGQGLAEQVPKEIEHQRLKAGLQELERDSANLDPMQFATKAFGTYGITPQMTQSLGELAKQRMRGKAIGEQGSTPIPFPQPDPSTSGSPSEVPSLTQESTFAKAQEGFIPRSEPEKMATAGQKYNANPAFYGNDPQKAIEYENQIDKTNQERAQAFQTKHENLSNIQDNVVNRLQGQYNKLKGNVPSDLFSRIEDEAIQATKPKSEGGRGLTEQQAMKEYGKKLDDISREYSDLNTVTGGWNVTNKSAKDTLGTLKALQSDFEKRNDTRNFAETLVKNGNSYPMAYAIAEPVHREPALNKELSRIPAINETISRLNPIDPIAKTLEIAPKISKLLGSNGSPLAVAHELEKKGYDGSTWLDYLIEHRDDLDLKESQAKQLDKNRNLIPTLNDWWLSAFSGIK